MARILLAWELGDGLGHVGRLLPIAQELRKAGHECVFAVRSLIPPYAMMHSSGFPLVQAPRVDPIAPPNEKRPTGAYNDILAMIGFSEVARLRPIVHAWENLVGLIAPDLVIADYSPILALTLYGVTPVIHVGDGFTLPPSQEGRFLPFLANGTARTDEAAQLAIAQQLQTERGRPLPGHLGALLETDSFVVTLPELDRFHGLRADRIVGPMERLPPPDLDAVDRTYFAYLSLTFRGTPVVLEALAKSGAPGSVFLRDADEARRNKYREMGLTVFSTPQEMTNAVGRASVLIHHGGLGTSEIGLAIGRPQMLVPRHLEQSMNAHCLARLGCAVSMVVGGNYDATAVEKAFTHITTHPSFAQSARQRAAVIAKRAAGGGVSRIVERCRQLLAGAPLPQPGIRT